MKKIFFIFLLLYAGNLFAIDRYVNPNLSSGNGTTLFTTITSAVNASVNGDRILVVAGTYNEPALTLNKSLTLLSQTAGSIINYNGNIIIAGFPAMKLEILGFNLGVYSLVASQYGGTFTSAPYGHLNRVKVSVIDCKMTNLSFDNDYYELNCIRSTMTGTTTFRFGNFVLSKTNDLFVLDEPSINQTGAKILIIGDTVLNLLEIRNDDFPILIANNDLLNLHFFRWNHLPANTNYIRNNNFNVNAQLLIGANPPSYNFEFSSNLFIGSVTFSSNTPCGNAGVYGFTVFRCNPEGCAGCNCCASTGFSSTFSLFPQPSTLGFFKWTFNGIDLPSTAPSGGDPLVLTKIIGPIGTLIDAGNPNHDYYDIDLTINNRGVTGGPYSIVNYNPSIIPSNGKAYIFDLEMPSDLFPGQQVDIKAKGYHRN
jgi:hypothetical protein